MAANYPPIYADREHWMRTKLFEILDHKFDRPWFMQNESNIRDTMRAALMTQKVLPLATKALALCIKYYRWHARATVWRDITQTALAEATNVDLPHTARHQAVKARIYVKLGEMLLTEGEHDSALSAAVSALEHGRESKFDAIKLEAMILFLAGQPMRANAELLPRRFKLAMKLAQSKYVSDELRQRLYQTLAKVHVHRFQFGETQHFARMAYRLSRKLDDWQGKLDTIILRAYAARYAMNLTHAERRLRNVEPFLDVHQNPAQYALVRYEQGIIALYSDRYGQAATYLSEAIDHYQNLKMDNHLGTGYHSLALTYIEAGTFTDAAKSLRAARKIYAKHQNKLGQTQLRLAEAYYALKRGHLCSAALLLADASSLTAAIRDESLRNGLAIEIAHYAQEVGTAWDKQKGGT